MSLLKSLPLLLTYAIGIGWAAYEWQSTPNVPAPAAVGEPAGLPEIVAPARRVTRISRYDAIVQRPLFNETRRPVPLPDSGQRAEPTGPDSHSPDALGLRLSAVFEGPGLRGALVENEQGESLVIYRNDTLGAWSVDEIGDDTVVFVHDGVRQVLKVHEFDTANPPPPSRLSQRSGRHAASGRAGNDVGRTGIVTVTPRTLIDD